MSSFHLGRIFTPDELKNWEYPFNPPSAKTRLMETIPGAEII